MYYHYHVHTFVREGFYSLLFWEFLRSVGSNEKGFKRNRDIPRGIYYKFHSCYLACHTKVAKYAYAYTFVIQSTLIVCYFPFICSHESLGKFRHKKFHAAIVLPRRKNTVTVIKLKNRFTGNG